MKEFSQGSGDFSEYRRELVDSVDADLLMRDEWGEYYDPEDFVARDQLMTEMIMLEDALNDGVDQTQIDKVILDAERIARIAAGLNRLQAYAYLMDEDSEQSVLRLKQQPFMRNICDYFEYDAGKREGGHAVIPTSVGKTVLFNEVIYATGLKTLVVADTKEQVKQNHNRRIEFARGRQIDSGRVDGDHKKVGKDVTDITYDSLLSEMRKPPHERIINPEDYDMIIFDEAHKVLGENRRTVIKYFDHAIKMAFTATDWYNDDKQVSILIPHEIVRMTLMEAEDEKLVAPHHNIIVETKIDMRNVPVASTGDFAKDVLFESINTDERNLVVVETYLTMHQGKKTIDFCGGIQHAKDLAKMYRDHGVPAEAVWGTMPDDDRRRIFKDFREGRLLHVTNADLITTGFDMKTVECAYLLQPSLSTLLVMQEGGRPGRLCEDLPAKVAYIVQFIDDQYRQPPVIFAEPNAAGSAMHGWDGFVFPDFVDTSQLPFTVFQDPTDVDFIAMQHHEDRESRNKYPPEGWASVDELKELSDRPLAQINKALSDFIKAQNELRQNYLDEGIMPEEGVLLDIDMHRGKFINPKTDSGRKKYLSPELVHRMAEHLRQYRVKDSVMWRRPHEAAEIFGVSKAWVDNNLLWAVRRRADMEHLEAKLVDNPESTAELLHFHYEMYEAGVTEIGARVNIKDLIKPPRRMKREEWVSQSFEDKFGEGAYELALSRSHETPLGWGNRARSIVYEMRGKLVHYYTPSALEDLERRLYYDPYRNQDGSLSMTPLSDLLTQGGLAKLGVTARQIEDEAAELLAKKPELNWRARKFYDDETNSFHYYGLKEIHVHIYERLVRKSKVAKSAEAIMEILEASPVLKRGDDTTDVVEEPVDEVLQTVQHKQEVAESETRGSKVDTKSIQEKLTRAQDIMERYRQMRRQ